MIAEYFSMQGRVYRGIRNPDGSRQPATYCYDASTLEVKQTKEREEKYESNTGGRTLAATLPTKRSMTYSLVLGQLNNDIAAIAADGVVVDITSGTVTNEAIGDVKAGDVFALAFGGVSDLALVDSAAAALVEDTDYTVDEDLGFLQFLTTKTGVKASTYDYAAQSPVTMGTATNEDHYYIFVGLNTTDGATTRCRGELYNCTTNPAETLGFIQSSFGEFSISGDCKMDPVRQLDPNFGPFGRLLLFQPT